MPCYKTTPVKFTLKNEKWNTEAVQKYLVVIYKSDIQNNSKYLICYKTTAAREKWKTETVQNTLFVIKQVGQKKTTNRMLKTTKTAKDILNVFFANPNFLGGL